MERVTGTPPSPLPPKMRRNQLGYIVRFVVPLLKSDIPNARHLPIGVRGVLRALSAVAAGKVAMCEKVSRHP